MSSPASRDRRTLRSARLLVALAALPSAGCVLQATEVLVVVNTNAPTDRNLELTVTVALPGTTTPTLRTWVRGPTAPGSITLPASFALTPAAGENLATPVTLKLHTHVEPGASGGPATDFDRIARFVFVSHQAGVLRMYLPVECGAPAQGCTSVSASQCTLAQRCADMGQTCNDDATCVAPDVTPVPSSQDDGSVNNNRTPDVVHPDAAPTDVPRADVPRADTGVDAGRDVTDVVSRDTGTPRDVTDVTMADSCACSPGATRMAACGNCGTRTDTCSSSCQWMTGTCSGQGACSPGATRNVGCPNCGTETDTCSSSCQWNAGTCVSSGCCVPIAGCTGGNGVGGVCRGDGDNGCGQGGCTCDTANGEQCSTSGSTDVGTCCHMANWYCADQSQCCPGLTCMNSACH